MRASTSGSASWSLGKTYELTVRGVLRGTGGEGSDPNRWEAQGGINWGGDTKWQHVSNWQGMDLGGIQVRTEPQSIGTYKVRFTAKEASMVLFLRGWMKWGVTDLEMDLNFDELSLRACEPMARWRQMQPEQPMPAAPCRRCDRSSRLPPCASTWSSPATR